MRTRVHPSTASALGLLLIVLGSLGGGCSFSSLTTATNLPEGQGQFFIAPGVSRYQRSHGEPLIAPQLELGGRYGITDRIEVGGKIWLPGAQTDVKVALLDKGRDEGGLRLALDPSLAYIGGFEGTPDGGATLHVITTTLPLLVGWRWGEHELVVGPRVVDQVWTGTGDTLTANIVAVGSSLGFAWYVGNGITLTPEVSVGAIISQALESFGSKFGLGGTLWQANLGVTFGGHASKDKPCSCPCQPAP